MAWIALLFAGLLEICWAVGLRYTDGFRKPWPTLGVVVALVGSVTLLTQAQRQIPLGTAYAVWVGIGAAGAVIAGGWLFGEPINPLRVTFLLLLLGAIVGLKLTA